jgi:hypothetical protein
MNPRRLPLGWLASFAVAAAAAVWTGSRASGQVGFAYEEPIALSPRELAGFDRILHSTPAEHTSAQTLVDAANAELKEQETKQGKIVAAWRALPKDKRTPEAHERVIKDVNAAEPDVAGVRRKLLLDMRSLLTQQQDADWPRFERFLRRYAWQTHNGWGSEQTNLFGLVEELDLDPAARAGLDDLLDRYGRELDAVLVDLEKRHDEMSKKNLEIWTREQQTGVFEADARRAASAEYMATSRRLTQLNDSFSENIRSNIPETKRALWNELYDQATLFEAYGFSWRWMDRAVRDSVNTPSIDDARREAIRTYLRSYTTEYDALTAKIAAMQRKLRAAGPGEQVDLPDWDPTRIRRANLLSEAQQKLKEILTPAQWERMMSTATENEHAWDDAMIR